jgi:hypothetical protein
MMMMLMMMMVMMMMMTTTTTSRNQDAESLHYTTVQGATRLILAPCVVWKM